jgi:hypothetical protein
MANTLRHTFFSLKPDGADTTKLRPSNWNAEHAFAGGALGSLLYRDPAQTDGASWLADVAAGSILVSGGVGAAPAWSASPSLVGILTTTVDGIQTTSTDGSVLENTTPATAAIPVQMPPRTRWVGNGWSTAFLSSHTVAWVAEASPVVAGPQPDGEWRLGFSLDGAALTYPLILTSAGGLTVLQGLQIGATASVNFAGIGFLTGGTLPGQFLLRTNTGAVGVGLDVSSDVILKLRARALGATYATLDCLGLKASGVAGASFGPGPIASITIVNGIVTAAS